MSTFSAASGFYYCSFSYDVDQMSDQHRKNLIRFPIRPSGRLKCAKIKKRDCDGRSSLTREESCKVVGVSNEVKMNETETWKQIVPLITVCHTRRLHKWL